MPIQNQCEYRIKKSFVPEESTVINLIFKILFLGTTNICVDPFFHFIRYSDQEKYKSRENYNLRNHMASQKKVLVKHILIFKNYKIVDGICMHLIKFFNQSIWKCY